MESTDKERKPVELVTLQCFPHPQYEMTRIYVVDAAGNHVISDTMLVIARSEEHARVALCAHEAVAKVIDRKNARTKSFAATNIERLLNNLGPTFELRTDKDDEQYVLCRPTTPDAPS
ncbi:MAG: hypothetical protein WCP91_00960 [Candidatus Berkelbacteria bacterium]